MLSSPELRLGAEVAQGAEGTVVEVLQGPFPPGGSYLFKRFHCPQRPGALAAVVSYPGLLARARPGHAARVSSSCAWPQALVGDDQGLVLGTVIRRAPETFWLSHRRGSPRLASLSYLAGDPDRLEVAYGLKLPAPGAPERVAVVYALARLLEAWQSEDSTAGEVVPVVAHGDLSAKNVLWSVVPAPAVFVLDCDGARLSGPAFSATGPPGRPGAGVAASDSEIMVSAPRVTTPNWDDPAALAGGQVGVAADRYLLGLAFLRVVGAANFPLQGRQRAGERVDVDLELPRSWRQLADMPGLWDLCERSLTVVGAEQRPSPSEWVAELERLLDLLGARDLAAPARRAQGDEASSVPPVRSAPPGSDRVRVPDVVVRPVMRHRAPSTWQLVSAQGVLGIGDAGAGGAPLPSLPARAVLRRALVLWGGAHRLAVRMARSPGRRAYGVRRLAAMAAFDLSMACTALFLFAMLVSPWVGL